jgi:hypothetical protein
MKIDNARVVLRDRKLMYMMAISSVLIISIILVADFFDNPILGISREVYIAGVATLYVVINIYRFILDLNYFSLAIQGEKIIIHYYSLRPFMQKRKGVEMPKSNLVKYQVNRSLFNQKRSLILYQKLGNKIAKYPPISISALNKVELTDLINILNSFTRPN